MKTRALEALVASKVSAGGSIELMDVVELLKAGQVPVDAVSRRLSGEDLARFQDLIQIAELEGQGRQKEGRPILLRLLPRQAFVNKVQEHLGGALLEFYKAQSATKNGQSKGVRRWRSDVRKLLDHGLVTALLHPIRGFTDRRKAFDLAAREIQVSDASYRTTAQNQVKRDFQLKRLKVELDEHDTKAFWRKVEAVATRTLSQP